jgi:hypothetical protein
MAGSPERRPQPTARPVGVNAAHQAQKSNRSSEVALASRGTRAELCMLLIRNRSKQTVG